MTSSASGVSVLVLDAGVEVLGVLPDDDQVHVVEPGTHPGVGLARAQAGVEVQLGLRSATFTERKPVPIGVVIGPLMATLFRLIDSRVPAAAGCRPSP